jgi:hypothetical protein
MDLAALGLSEVRDSCEHGNEPSDSIKGRVEISYQLSVLLHFQGPSVAYK